MNMDKSKNRNPINLSFTLDSNASLWNVVFEGFDQDIILISKFVGNDQNSVNTLYKFGNILKDRNKIFKVEIINTGITIKTYLPRNDKNLVEMWTKYMNYIMEEIVNISNSRH